MLAMLVSLCLVAWVFISVWMSSFSAKTGVSQVSSVRSASLTPSQVQGMLAGMKGISYYPRNAAQSNIWLRWNSTQVDNDLARIAGLHANLVRAVLFTTLGYPTSSPSTIQELSQFVSLAHQHGLRVQLTLFGFFTNYGDVAGSERWAQSVLSPYRDDPRIAFVELQNEIDPRNLQAIAWARTLVPYVQRLVDQIPVTLSVSGANGLSDLETLKAANLPIDFYDLHYYGLPELAYHTFSLAKEAVSPQPLLIGEVGRSTAPPPGSAATPYGERWREALQDQYLRTVDDAAQVLGLPLPIPWILWDYQSNAFPRNSQAGKNPAEYDYGLYHTDGTAKPAAVSLRAIYGGQGISSGFNNGFESATSAGLPTNWLVWQDGYATFTRSTVVYHTGSASACISKSTAGPTGLPSFYATPILPIQDGRRYTATAWVRGPAATGRTYVALSWFDVNGKYIQGSTASSATLQSGNEAWTQLAATSAVPTGAVSIQIDLVSTGNSGTACFDDVRFYQAP